MKRYTINTVNLPPHMRERIEWQLHGASIALHACTTEKLHVSEFVTNWIAFKTNSSRLVSSLALEFSNYGLTIEEKP